MTGENAVGQPVPNIEVTTGERLKVFDSKTQTYECDQPRYVVQRSQSEDEDTGQRGIASEVNDLVGLDA